MVRVSQRRPRSLIGAGVQPSPQKLGKKPNPPSSTVAGPVTPWAARPAALTAQWAAHPRGRGCRQPASPPEQRRLACPSPPLDPGPDGPGGLLLPSGQGHPEGVQEVVLGAAQDFLWNLLEAELGGEGRQLLGERHPTTASGRRGEPVAPTSFNGQAMKANS